MDQWHFYPFQYRLLGFAFTMSLLPQSALTLAGAVSLVRPIPFCFLWRCSPLHLCEQLPPNQQSLTFLLFVTPSLPLQTLILHTVHGWTQTVPTNMMTKPYHQTHSWLSYSTMSQKQGGELLLEQTGNETVTGSWRTGNSRSCHKPVAPAFIQWWLWFTTISNVNTQLEQHFLIYIQTFADTRIPETFFVSFYLKVVIQADLCAGLLFPVHLSGLLQLQLLLLVLSSQTLLLWQ